MVIFNIELNEENIMIAIATVFLFLIIGLSININMENANIFGSLVMSALIVTGIIFFAVNIANGIVSGICYIYDKFFEDINSENEDVNIINNNTEHKKKLNSYISSMNKLHIEDTKLKSALNELKDKLILAKKDDSLVKKSSFENMYNTYLPEIIENINLLNKIPDGIDLIDLNILKADLLKLINNIKDVFQMEIDNHYKNVLSNASTNLKAIENKIEISGLLPNKSFEKCEGVIAYDNRKN